MGASSERPADSTIEAGLPDITGGFGVRLTSDDTYASIVDMQGAFYGTSLGPGAVSSGFTYLQNVFYYAHFSASNSSAIYGNSSTVQPSSYFVYIWKRIE